MWNTDRGPLAWWRRTFGPAPQEDTPPEPEPSVPAPTSREWINAPELLAQLGEDLDLLRELSRLFVEEREKRIVLLQEALAAGNAVEVGRAAHGIKSGMTNFCAPEAVALAATIEHAGRAGDLSEVPARLRELQACMADMEAQLERLGSTP